jgi:HPt (histidine-containing phosphotransfer) domain-containing protein
VTDLGADPIDAMAFANLLEMTGGDQAFVDELVDTYLQEGASLVDRLRTAAATGAGDDLVRAAHSLKSSSMNVGALPLGELCRSLETEARTGTVPDVRDRAEEIAAAFEGARQALLAERERRAG